MSLREWFDYNAGIHPHQLGFVPSVSVVDAQPIEVTEGEVAAVSHRIHAERSERAATASLEAQVAEDLQRAVTLLP